MAKGPMPFGRRGFSLRSLVTTDNGTKFVVMLMLGGIGSTSGMYSPISEPP